MQINVNASGQTDANNQIPGNAQGTRRKLIFRNTGSNTVYWGFEPGTSASGATQGVPLATNEGMVIDGINTVNKPVYFVTASATASTINYTELA